MFLARFHVKSVIFVIIVVSVTKIIDGDTQTAQRISKYMLRKLFLGKHNYNFFSSGTFFFSVSYVSPVLLPSFLPPDTHLFQPFSLCVGGVGWGGGPVVCLFTMLLFLHS